jgi:hypothetical protein
VNGVDAGKLVAFAVDVTATPGGSGEAAEYARLVDRYLADASFRRLVDDILEGVGCEVTDATLHAGLIVRSQLGGPWCWPARGADLPWNKSFLDLEERAARMIVVPALLAYVAPAAADFDDLLSDPTVVPATVSVRDLERFIRDFAQQHEAESPDPAGEERPAWWYWLQPSEDTSGRKRISRKTTTYLTYDVLQFLHRQGLLVKTTGTSAADAVYRPRRRLLAHYRDLLIDDLFTALRDFAAAYGRPDTVRRPDEPSTGEA